METNFELLKQYVETSGNCVNLGRHLKSSNPNLYTWILEKTEFLNVKTNVKDTERMYCILNDIWEIPKTPFGDFALFVSIFGGYSLKKYSYARNQKFKEKRKTVEERKMQREQERMNRDPLAEYVNKHKQKNHHLYGDEMIEGYDYVICPITQLRRMMIKSNYITNYLGMTVEEFDTKFPGIKKVCDKHKDNISKGVNEIDIETGLTKHKIGTQKARLTLLTPDENGVTGYMKLGQKTKNTHMNNIDERGRNGYSQLASKAIVKGNATKVERGLILPPTDKDEFYRYKIIIIYLTNRLRNKLSNGFKTGLAGTDGAYHIDHRFSIKHGYLNQVSPFVVGHEMNLEMLSWEENVAKQSKSSIELDELLEITGYSEDKSKEEFAKIIEIIQEDIKNNVTPNGAYLLERLNNAILRK